MYTFIELFTTNNIPVNTLKKLGLFFVKAFEHRNAVVNNHIFLQYLRLYITCSVFSSDCDMYLYVLFRSHRIVYLYIWVVSMCLCFIRPNKSYVVVAVVAVVAVVESVCFTLKTVPYIWRINHFYSYYRFKCSHESKDKVWSTREYSSIFYWKVRTWISNFSLGLTLKRMLVLSVCITDNSVL